MSRILFRPAAVAELEEAHRWYERQRAGLGDEFLQAVQVLVARLAENPLAFLVVHRGDHYSDASHLKLVAENKAELPGRDQLCAFFGPIQRYATSYCIAEALSAFKLKSPERQYRGWAPEECS